MHKKIGVIWGDCASKEIVAQALSVLEAIEKKYGHEFEYTKILMGGEAIDEMGEP
ncbi:isocitrate/isopropylmalate family dehydrogenase, partial [Dubosiella newyorkensis]